MADSVDGVSSVCMVVCSFILTNKAKFGTSLSDDTAGIVVPYN